MFHFSPITADTEGETCRRGGGSVYARGSPRGCLSSVSASLSGKLCWERANKRDDVTQSLVISSAAKQNMRGGNQGGRKRDGATEEMKWGGCLSPQN